MNRKKNTPPPVEEVPWAPLDWGLELVAGLTLLGVWTWLLLVYGQLPASLPSHYSALGQADAFDSKASLWLLMAIPTGLYVLLTWAARKPHTFNYPIEITPQNAAFQYANATRMIRYLKTVLVLAFGYIVLRSMYPSPAGLGAGFLVAFFVALFLPLTYFLQKTFRSQ
jgi:hypothetical protein